MAKLRLVVGALALLLALPLADAAAARGQLDAASVALVGPVDLRAASGDIRWTGQGAPLLDATAATVHVERHGFRTERASTVLTLSTVPVSERSDHATSALRLEGGGADALLALRTTLPLDATLADAQARPAAYATLAQPRPDDGCIEGDPLCWEAFGVTEARADQAAVTLPGEVRFLLYGPTLVVEEGGQSVTYASGRTQRTEGTTSVTEDVWVLVVLTGAAGTLDASGDVAVYAPSPTLGTSRATLDAATGRVDDGFRAYLARGEAMDIQGDLDLALGAVDAGPATAADVTYADAFAVAVRGDVQAVSVRALPFYSSSPYATVGLAATLLALAGAAAYAWPLVQFHATSAFLPFYTRLRPPQLLDNGVRNGIYSIICANPGISARAVHRLSEQSWGTVVYHLRQLEKHDLVVSRAVGRTRNYYENHGKYRGMEVQLACLRNERARVLARLVVDTPGIAQEELVARSTYPQPTTSYYVRKLKSAGLVEERRDGRYARYHPTGDVARFLDLADQHAPAAQA